MAQVRVDSQLRCPYCHDALARVGRKTGCESCLAWHHAACMAELGACANCGAVARSPSAEFERARLSELLERGCSAQGCRSIETIHVGLLGYKCRRHLRLNSLLQACMALIFGLTAPLLLVIAFTQRADLDLAEVLAFLAPAALLCLGSGVLAWQSRRHRAALAGFDEARRPEPSPAEEVHEPSLAATRRKKVSS